MVQGHFDTRTYTPENNIIQMDNWYSATLYNTGDVDVDVMGVTVKPEESFVIGNSTIALIGSIHLKFASKENAKAIVHYIQPEKC